MHDESRQPRIHDTSVVSEGEFAPDPPRSIGDDYPEYVEETLGYQWDAFDLLNPARQKRHDSLRAIEAAEIATIDPSTLEDDLERLAFAHACIALGAQAEAMHALESIAHGLEERGTYHVGVAYDEVLEHLAMARASDGRGEEALAIVETLKTLERAPRAALVHAMICWMNEAFDEAHRLFDLYVSEERERAEGEPEGETLERYYDIAYALSHHAGATSAARAWVKRGMDGAKTMGYRALVVDFTLFLDRLDAQTEKSTRHVAGKEEE